MSIASTPSRLRFSRRVAAAFTATALISTLGAVPAAHAQTEYRTATGGSLVWGFKQSFRNYIQTGVAKGSIELGDGAQDSGGSFAFSPRENGTSVTSDSEGSVAFSGSVHFVGHQAQGQWILDTTLSDIKLLISGSQAQIQADLVAREFKGTTYDDIGDFVISDDIILANVSLNSAADFSQDSIDLSGTTTLTSAGAQAFGGFYESGEVLDPTGGSLTIASTTTTPTTGTSTTTTSGTASADCSSGALGVITTGDSDGILGTLQEVNNTFALWNNLIVNTERMFCNVDTLKARFNVDDGDNGTDGTDGTGTAASTVASTASTATTATSPTTVSTGAAGTTTTPSTSGTSTGTGGTTPSDTGVCTASGSLGVTQATAQWGVKASFQNYIRGSIAKGQWTLNGVGFENQQFQFQGASGAVDVTNKSGSIVYPGSIHFTGHDGILDMQISNLEISFSGNSGELIAEVVSSDMEGNSTNYGRTVVGTLNFSSLTVTDSHAQGAASVALSEAGSKAFADFYTPGTALDPISFSATLGGASNCDSTTAGLSPTQDAGAVTDASVNSESVSDPAVQDSQFQIRQAGSDATGIDTTTTLLLILAAFVVAGGSMTRFTIAHPSGK
ncbi:HtaA domain-containing protein [Corynebacterium deserti]|nr:HtaA domain-containing protein [Corynebacterium deserti]